MNEMRVPNQRLTAASLLDIAVVLREQFEDGRLTNDEILDAYGPLEPLYREHLGDEMDYIRRLFPAENCEYGTVMLCQRVGYGVLWAGTYMGLPHKFLDVGATDQWDDTIMDITADQFGGPPVYVGPLVSPWRRERIYTAQLEKYDM